MAVLATLKSLARLGARVGKRFVAVFLLSWIGLTLFPVTPAAWTLTGSLTVGWMSHSVSVLLIRWLEARMLPPGVILIAIGPFDAFQVITEMGAILALMVALPVLLHDLWVYASPGLLPKERRVGRKVMVLGFLLFVAGAALALLVMLPAVFAWSYQLNGAISAVPTVSIFEFINTIMLFTLLLGAAFQVPTVLYILSMFGIVKAKTLEAHTWTALLGSFILAFLISPGVGGGLIEIPLGFGLWGMYYASYKVIARRERRMDLVTKESPEAVTG